MAKIDQIWWHNYQPIPTCQGPSNSPGFWHQLTLLVTGFSIADKANEKMGNFAGTQKSENNLFEGCLL